MPKIYERNENGTTAHVSQRDGLAEINHAMMAGQRKVKTMSSITRTDYAIEYKDGRSVRLILVDAPAPEATPDAEPKWSVASHRMLLHRFTEDGQDGRALCNKRFRPYRYANGYSFETRTARDAGQHGDLYTYCPRCEKK
jgi:hypothetical protein